MNPTPRCPYWAVEAGVPAPEPDEPYRAYWARVGVPEDVIDWSLQVRPGAEDIGNDRMATWLRLWRPGMFLEAVDRLAYKHGIPIHKIGTC